MTKAIIFILIIIIFSIGAYFLGTKNLFQQNPPPTSLPSPTPSPASNAASPSPSPLVSPEPSVQAASPNPTINPAMLENIKASIVSKNTAALEGYMTDTVNVIAEASECCGNVDKTKAIKELDYLVNNAALPWNFDDDNPVAIALRQKNPAAFPQGIIIGTSANRWLVTFTLNEDKTKIEKLYTASDYKLHGI